MFKRYARYGTTEVANSARVAEYARNGIAPQGLLVNDCSDCDDIAAAVGDASYDSPLLDGAPWMDQANPDSADFAGVMILDMSGIEGSTNVAEVTDRLGDGGIVGGRRARPRSMKVSAVALGRTPAGLDAGIAWLGAALHPPCSGGDCGGDTLHMFSACPPVCEGQTDVDALPITTVYGDFSEFSNASVSGLVPPMMNLITHPSAEAGVLGQWSATNTGGGAYVAGSATTAAPPVVLTRPNAYRLVAPALTSGQAAALSATFTVPTTGSYEVSAWVYVPAATTLSVSIAQTGTGESPAIDVKNQWVRVTRQMSLTAGAVPRVAVVARSIGASAAAGMVVWVDGISVRLSASFRSGADLQGRLSTDNEGWGGSDGFGAFTPATAATIQSFASPHPIAGAPNRPRSLQVAWASALTPGTRAHAVYSLIDGTVPGNVYTVECDVYLTAGSADIEVDVIYNTKGQRLSPTGGWQHVKTTFVALTVAPFFGFTSVVGDDMAGPGEYLYVANTRVSEGYDAPPLGYFDGATADTTRWDYSWTGAADASTSLATPIGNDFVFKPTGGNNRIVSPSREGVCDTVTVEWLVSSASGADVEVYPSILNVAGTTLVRGETQVVGPGQTIIRWEGAASPDFPERWRAALDTIPVPGQGPNGRPLIIYSLSITHRPVLTLEQCVGPYRRTLENVVTIEGPTVVEEWAVGDDGEAVMARVEWTWVAATPWVYATPTPVLTTVVGRGSGPADAQAPGVQLSPAVAVTAAATACALPAPTLLTCADNGCATPLVAPPSAPVFADPSLMVPTGYSRRTFQIPPTVTPAGLGVLSWTFINDGKPKFGVRVRVWEDPDPDFGIGEAQQCEWVQEFTIDYLAAGQSLVIDGRTETAQALCGLDAYNQPIWVDSLRNVSGGYGGPFLFEPIGCGRRYHVAVDIPNTYTATCPGAYNAGDGQGDLTWSVNLTRRS